MLSLSLSVLRTNNRLEGDDRILLTTDTVSGAVKFWRNGQRTKQALYFKFQFSLITYKKKNNLLLLCFFFIKKRNTYFNFSYHSDWNPVVICGVIIRFFIPKPTPNSFWSSCFRCTYYSNCLLTFSSVVVCGKYKKFISEKIKKILTKY